MVSLQRLLFNLPKHQSFYVASCLFCSLAIVSYPNLGLSQESSLSPPPIHPSCLKRRETQDQSQTFTVKSTRLIGSTVFSESDPDFTKKGEKIKGKTVTIQELQAIADWITGRYFKLGYITSQVILCDNLSKNGDIVFQAVEGKISLLKITGNQSLHRSYLERRIRLGTTFPFRKDLLEDQLRLLKVDPLFNQVRGKLSHGERVGESILEISVEEAPRFSAQLSTDNFSPPSVGSERFGMSASYRSLVFPGDEISASYYRTWQGGANSFDFNYRVPVNPMNGTLQFRIAPSNSKIITRDFKSFDIRSNSLLYEMSYRQPIIRTPREELALSVNLTFQDGQTFLFNDIPYPFGIGPDADGTSRTRVLKLGQDYVKRDPTGAWALRSQFNFGLNLLNATQNDSPIPDGQFFSWLGQLQRAQRLGADHLLIAQAEVQLTPDSLLPSQQLTIGGGQSLRGYRQSIRSGDNGFRFSLEDRITIQRDGRGASILQLTPFFECGSVWNHPENPNFSAKQNFLAGIGAGIIWQPNPKLFMRLDYALPLVKIADRSSNLQDQALYFSFQYTP